jgi:hypothetical protein
MQQQLEGSKRLQPELKLKQDEKKKNDFQGKF